jgi:hypothetical protein
MIADSIKIFKTFVEGVKAARYSGSFKCDTLHVWPQACSWNAMERNYKAGSLAGLRRRRFGNIYSGSVVQALVERIESVNDYTCDAIELRNRTDSALAPTF